MVAGNWKMNLTKMEAMHLYGEIELGLENIEEPDVVCFVPFVHIDALTHAQNYNSRLVLGAQNFYPSDKGAFTGEISIHHLKDLEIDTVLIGHSERREILNENDNFIKQKVDIAIASGFKIFFCCGESLATRNAGQAKAFVEEQLRNSLLHLPINNMVNVVIAYEPIWAIGSGLTATKEEANEMHQFIRSILTSTYNATVANETRILYGGSCNPSNADDLFEMPDIDGGLIGGASLQAQDFLKIIHAAK